MTPRAALPLIALASLGACARVVSDVCPTLPRYPAELQARAADELDALPKGSVIATMIADYGVMRAELRAGGCGDE